MKFLNQIKHLYKIKYLKDIKNMTIIFFALCINFAAVPLVSAATFHSVIVADTKDASIGDSTKIDAIKMQAEMKKIAQYSDMKFSEVVITGNYVKTSTVLNVVNQMKMDSEDDVIFFYFSGHGYRTESKDDSPWPYLYFSLENRGIDYDQIITQLSGKGSRFLFLMVDACNNYIEEEYAPLVVSKNYSLLKSIDSKLEQNYHRLFRETKGRIIVTSSSVGEYSYGTNMGGLFTIAFIKSLGFAVNGATPTTWEQILVKSSQLMYGEQTPKFELELDYDLL